MDTDSYVIPYKKDVVEKHYKRYRKENPSRVFPLIDFEDLYNTGWINVLQGVIVKYSAAKVEVIRGRLHEYPVGLPEEKFFDLLFYWLELCHFEELVKLVASKYEFIFTISEERDRFFNYSCREVKSKITVKGIKDGFCHMDRFTMIAECKYFMYDEYNIRYTSNFIKFLKSEKVFPHMDYDVLIYNALREIINEGRERFIVTYFEEKRDQDPDFMKNFENQYRNANLYRNKLSLKEFIARVNRKYEPKTSPEVIDYAYTSIDVNSLDDILASEKIKFDFRKYNGNQTKWFDMIVAEVALMRRGRTKEQQMKSIRKYKKTLDQLVINKLQENKKFIKSEIPIGFLKLGNLVYRNDDILEYTFEIKGNEIPE